jgi:hypothetical protein
MFMVQAKQMQQRRMPIMHVDFALNRMMTKLISPTVAETRFHPAAG